MTHADEARRIVDKWCDIDCSCCSVGNDCADVVLVGLIAAALAAAERAGIERAAEAAEAWDPECDCSCFGDCDICVPRHNIARAIRALLLAAVAEPAAKCANPECIKGQVPSNRGGWMSPVPCSSCAGAR